MDENEKIPTVTNYLMNVIENDGEIARINIIQMKGTEYKFRTLCKEDTETIVNILKGVYDDESRNTTEG